MCVHLLVNASVNNGAATFQKNVYNIHQLGALLPVVEWLFIFLPILFHAIIGVMIVAGGLPNSNHYRYAANRRYTWQRITGMIAFVFIFYHVFHMHGWFHNESWLANVVHPLGGGQFRPYNATSTAGVALSAIPTVLYAIGVLASVFHFSNGLWTMGITWGVWTSAAAQSRATVACAGLGAILAVVGLSGIFGLRSAVATPQRLEEVRELEAKMLEARIAAGELEPNEHKTATDEDYE
jgi:succinate dehydrogenase / fumarate reductase cytochrome b subunit